MFFLQVLVMTPQILLNNLRHSFFKLSMINVLVFDECHHASGNHPYAGIMTVSCDTFFFLFFLSSLPLEFSHLFL